MSPMLALDPGAEPAAPRRIPPAVVAIAAWAVLRTLQIAIGSTGFGNDVNGYFGYARSWAAGRIPYVEYLVEYPPGALILFLAPFLAGGGERYKWLFACEMAVFDLACLALVVALAQRFYPGDRRRQALAAAAYLAATALLHPVLYARFDLAPAALTAAAIFLSPLHPAAAALALGLGGAVKLWPLALAPLWLAAADRKGGHRATLRTAGLLALGYLLPALPFLPRAGLRVFGFLRFHAARGVQIESTWGSLALVFGGQPKYEYGAWDVQCAACGALATLSLPALAIFVGAPLFLAARREGAFPQRGLLGATAAAAGFLLAGKVLSPQFILWISPLFALCGFPAQAALVAAAGLTTLVYPILYPALLDAHSAGHAAVVAAVLARNALLAGAYGWLIARLARRSRT